MKHLEVPKTVNPHQNNNKVTIRKTGGVDNQFDK